MEIKVEQNISLKELNTFRVGGPVRFFAKANNWQTVVGLREFAKKQGVPFMILGGGSNVLFADDGYPGLIILNQMSKIQLKNNLAICESGVYWSKLVLFAAEYNLGGISGFCNVPGTVGGAAYGNAGIPGIYMEDVFVKATILPANSNKPVVVGPDYFKFSYRDSELKRTGDIILNVVIKMRPMPKGVIKQEVSRFIKSRIIKQPAGLTCGSFFKNPGTFPSAGWLIEQSGCKGMSLGGAEVSKKHGNFFMNTGKATASDVINLALNVHRIVKEKFDVELEPEVQILPDNPFKK